jgi:phenylalanyl-tRNA synthetase beta chain
MKISELWLREWANPPVDTPTLLEQLTMAGLEVESAESCAPSLDQVVVGRVLERGKHPNADKLSICKVVVGAAEPLQIVCGASNVVAGGTYPVALVGAVLPGDFKIKRSKIRGEESFGMLCSAVELGIADKADGLLELDAAMVPGTPIATALALNDTVIDVNLTPNRADCFSILGVARDLAALNALPFSEPVTAPVKATCSDAVTVHLNTPEACPVFAGRVVRGINSSATTPLWMMERLRRCGIRPLHPVVDITNYVMLEFGQPMHAYDLATLSGDVTVRMAAKGEKLRLLGGAEQALDPDMLVIADANGAVALAGIMGGDASAVAETTTDVFLESAFFSPAAMAGRARRCGLHTDASLRFERGVDHTRQTRAIERATELLLQIVGGEAGPVTEVRKAEALPLRPAVALRRARLDSLLGIAVSGEEVAAMLARLGCRVEGATEGWTVTPPAHRFDLAIEEDLIEEVVRLHGYHRLPEIPQRVTSVLTRVTETRVGIDRARHALIDRGYQEIISYSFTDADEQRQLLGTATELELSNPISRELSVMRRSLWPGLLQAVSANQKRQQNRLRLFETGAVYRCVAGTTTEVEVIGGVAWGAVLPEHWDGKSQCADLFDIKSDIEALLHLTGAAGAFTFATAEHAALRPGQTARIQRDGVDVGWCGELHPQAARHWGLSPAPVMFEIELAKGLQAKVPAFNGISRFPAVRRDIAVIVARELTAAQLIDAARSAVGRVLRDVLIFDVYTGKGIETGLKSVALGLILQETSRTLTELEIDSAIAAVVECFSREFNASIRE